MSKFLIAVTEDLFASYAEEQSVLGEIDAELRVFNLNSTPVPPPELQQVDGLLATTLLITSAFVANLRKCKVISRYGVGYDNIDVQAATDAGIWVCRVTDFATEEVSDHAVALLLDCVRMLSWRDRRIRQGEWNLQPPGDVLRIKGKTLGLVGYGDIGQAVHRKLSGFQLGRVLVCDPFVSSDRIRSSGGTPCALEDLIGEADFISLHAPLTSQTLGLIAENEISRMKSTAILINTARGKLVDEKALVQALQNKCICAAGLDVLACEPPQPDNLLLTLDNVVLSDHAAWYSKASLGELKRKAAQNVVAVLKGERPDCAINNPTENKEHQR